MQIGRVHKYVDIGCTMMVCGGDASSLRERRRIRLDQIPIGVVWYEGEIEVRRAVNTNTNKAHTQQTERT